MSAARLPVRPRARQRAGADPRAGQESFPPGAWRSSLERAGCARQGYVPIVSEANGLRGMLASRWRELAVAPFVIGASAANLVTPAPRCRRALQSAAAARRFLVLRRHHRHRAGFTSQPQPEAYMRQRSLQRNGGLVCVVLTAVAAFSACSPGDSADRPAAAPAARACATPADSVIGLATQQFVRSISPKPHRFLIPAGTDSAVPTSAYWALQSTGATLNMYPKDTAQQKLAVRQLGANGSYTLLLTSYHGQRTLSDGQVSLEFSGRWLNGDLGGKEIPRTAVLFNCGATANRFVVEQRAAPTP